VQLLTAPTYHLNICLVHAKEILDLNN
jgi:hypothetical protein